jgi:glucokinase
MIVDILNPEAIVIGSVFARTEKLIRPTMEKMLTKEALGVSAGVCKVLPASLGESIGDFAALAVAFEGEKNNL